MINILVVCRREYAEYNQIFSYSKRCGINFFIAVTNEEIRTNFADCKPALFIVECYDICQTEIIFLKKLSPDTPIIGLCTEKNEDIAVNAYKNGAINVIHLPFGKREFYYYLLAVLNWLEDKKTNADTQTMGIGDLKISLRNCKVMRNGSLVPLTNTEYKILLLLADNLNDVVSINELYAALWSTSTLKETSRTLQMHISNLRRKLCFNQHSFLNIVTVHRKGYSLITKDNLLYK